MNYTNRHGVKYTDNKNSRSKVILITLAVIVASVVVVIASGAIGEAISKPGKAGTILNISDMTQRSCDDIVRDPNGTLVCEIAMIEEDDNMIILKEN